MNDNLSIEGLKVDTIIGVYQWEREVKQSVIIDLVLRTQHTQAREVAMQPGPPQYVSALILNTEWGLRQNKIHNS